MSTGTENVSPSGKGSGGNRGRHARSLLWAFAWAFGRTVISAEAWASEGDESERRSPSTSSSVSPGQREWSEGEVLAHWLAKSPEVSSWRLQVGAARFDVMTASLLPNPEVNFSVNGLAFGTPPDGTSGEQLQVGMALPIFGQYAARRLAAEKQLDVVEAQVMVTMWLRASDLQDAMVHLAFAEARMDTLRKNRAELDRLRKVVAARSGVGANSAYDAVRVTTAAGILQASETAARLERDQAEAALRVLVADPALESIRVTCRGLQEFRGPEDEGQLLNLALRRRPDLVWAQKALVASNAEAHRFRKEAVPSPSAFAAGYLVQYAPDMAVRGPSGLQVTAGVQWPIPVFNRNQGQLGRALTEAQGRALDIQATEARIRAEVAGAWRSRKVADAALQMFQSQSRPAADEMLRRAEVTYQAGAFSITELFDAYQTIWEFRNQQWELERKRAEAEVALERAAVLLTLPGAAVSSSGISSPD